MASGSAEENSVSKVMKELNIARSELSNIRQQIVSLKHLQQNYIENLNSKLTDWKCELCSDPSSEELSKPEEVDPKTIHFQPIGYVSTQLTKKRGAPRQPSVCPLLVGKLTILKSVFNNPEHALDGLQEYSHMWIIYQMDRNDSKHLHAKVFPPRLNGKSTGVFSTRSPHRPCPLGLSLVQIDRVQGSTIYFSGVDMLDHSPVLDIKPFIPAYDSPSLGELSAGLSASPNKLLQIPVAPGSPGIDPGSREDPDGEESDDEHKSLPSLGVHPSSQAVRVPSWVVSNDPKTIVMSEEVAHQLEEMGKSDLNPVIQQILREDPRSVYLRQRYSNQFYTFLISDLHVSCKFDDFTNSVSIYRVNRASRLSEGNEEDIPADIPPS